MPEGQLLLEPPAPGEALPRANAQGRRDPSRAKSGLALCRESLHTVVREGVMYLVSENYSYKSEAYYSILMHETQGEKVAPGTRAILDAFVVPVCLERARMEGIPVAEYAISQSCIQAPAVIYGLNYFACTSHFEVLREDESARELIRHVTNNGKYPFCSQRLEDGATIRRAVSIFGNVSSPDPAMAGMAAGIWEAFWIPLVEIICLDGPSGLRLSSLCPVRYSRLAPAEKELLSAYLSGQVFL
ncbi:MAG: hypothetical protein A4E40_01495 [Methanoregulaceae archaeon PtaU1.Bin059]|nr:MAG: hypothetical protein A4E39_01232 [Methanoregulaceae archaeon PtaB.Bin152]OPY36594.1 MAG: hypothetical protein A4E40_01495 [Methanoregulaceae archaeon PtaU1.Bin059]